MKLLVLFFIFLNVSALAQDYERVDAIISMYPQTFENPEKLSKFITRDFTSDEDKIRAIYTWIIQNVAYDPDEYKQFDYTFTNYRERNEKDEKLRAKITERTLQKGIAVCEGYAMLFEVCTGLSRASFEFNHMYIVCTHVRMSNCAKRF